MSDMRNTTREPTSRERLLDAGQHLFWHRGFNDVGLSDILKRAGVPKGSFYHHFESKEGFGLEVVDLFAAHSAEVLGGFLDSGRPPLESLRLFFEHQRDFYEANGCQDGCLLANFGQELAETSEPLRSRIEFHLNATKVRIRGSLEAAQRRGELGDADLDAFADVLLSGWHGALLRMKVEKSLSPIDAFLAFLLPQPAN